MTSSTAFLLTALALLAAILVALGFARRATLLLTAKYLVKRRLAWVSLMAVALCVALVLIVLSVMGGWLANFKASFKTLTGDLIVSRSSISNFAHYDEMIVEIERLPEVEAAIPLIRTAGLLAIPTGTGEFNDYVGVVGLPPIDQVERVMAFADSLWLQHDIAEFEEKRPLRAPASFALWDDVPYAALSPKDRQATRRPGLIVGAGAIGVRKDPKTGLPTWPGSLTSFNCRLTVVPSGEELGGAGSTINATTTPYWIVDGSRTQAPQHDKNIYVPFAQLQRDLNLTAYEFVDATTGETRTQPAKATEIQVKVRPGVDARALKSRVQSIVNAIVRAHQPQPATQPEENLSAAFEIGGLRVQTWEEQQSGFLNAVENEITIMMTLFGCISLVAVFMIFCIFYTIVAEKTRDIGILKSVGASAWNVAQIFLTYGAAIGLVGGGAGVAMGWAFVRNINTIHGWIAEVTGREIFSSEVYALDRLPTDVDLRSAIIIWAIGIFAAVVGAIVPAVLAARKNPVEALRFE